MQERTTEQKVAVDLRIVLAHQIAGARKRHNMIKQPPDVGMMQSLRRRSVTVSRSDFGISHKRQQQRFQMRILERSDEVRERLPKFVNVFSCLRKVVVEFDFRLAQLAQFVNCELEAVLILVN